MSTTASDAIAVQARFRALTLGRLGLAAALAVGLAGFGGALIDPAGRHLLLWTGATLMAVNLLALAAPARPLVLRGAMEITTVADAAAIAVVLAVTGGVVSPLAPLLYAEAVAVTLVFGWWTGLRTTAILSLALVWVLSVSPDSLAAAADGAASGDLSVATALTPSLRGGLMLAALWLLSGLVAALSVVAERELRRWLDDLALLRDVTHELDPRQGVERLCDELAQTLVRLGYRGAAVWFGEGGSLVATGSAGAVGDLHDRLPPRLAVNAEPLSGTIAANRPWPVRRSDPRPSALDRVHGEGAALVLVPLLTDDRLLGVLSAEVNATVTGPPQLRGHDLRRLRLLADQAALLLENARLQGELRSLAITDGLTGLPNHRYLQQRLGEEVDRVIRRAEGGGDPQPLSVALFDLDHFKAINDRFGHPTGDAVLTAVARTAQEVLRSSDVVCRYGGEEFAIVLVDTPEREAIRACDRLAGAIRALGLSSEDGRPLGTVTASFGVATTVGPALGRAELISHADRALYAAKHAGRDRVVHAHDLPPEGAEIELPTPVRPAAGS